ncbi:hypothetical protein N0V83_004792 [Neocucurbitaria cava]|uniref:histidine kinase n=1 Tax=Neocucurbitaria cava TaxID=798079 RepID=A0A9W8YC72_9PLEO|nr:hypothetical protein N0V83_004792 [Neocucurbitaria cava]
MQSTSGHRPTFFPKADTVILPSNRRLSLPTPRPTEVAPIFDIQHVDQALDVWSADVAQSVYPQKDDQWAPAPIPERAECPRHCAADRYLFPVLTRNERLRLTMLFYYTRGASEDQELMARLQEKVDLARETIGWEFVIAGLLNHNTYTRMVTTIFSLLDMAKDWRFEKSPHVENGGLRAYAGAPLKFETEFGEQVAFGSLCVASNSVQEELSETQQTSLARFADWIVADIIHSAKARRQRERRRMQEVLDQAQKLCDEGVDMTEAIPKILQEYYPDTTVGVHRTVDGQIVLDGGTVFKTVELEHGLWEDTEQCDYIIERHNNQIMVSSRVIRIIAAQCTSQRIPTFLVVGCKDFRRVFDDVDAWFVHMCATILCTYWQSGLLKEALEAKETFLRGITHSLRTPIHGILGSVELLTEELKSRNVVPISETDSPRTTPGTEQLDPYVYIRTIKTSGRELISTINSLLKLNQWAGIAQSERHIALHSIAEIEAALLNEISFAMQDDISTRPTVLIRHHFPLNFDLLVFDLRLFLDCIQPLVTNGIQNTPGGVVAVTLSVSDDCSVLNVDVEDNGRGIATVNHERIFNAYEKIDSHTAEAGLGLTLASKSALLMNGKTQLVSSHLGRGSHFRATFSDPVCASMFPQNRSIKERLVQLPPTFRRLTSDSSASPLGLYFTKYLAGYGYLESTTSDGSFLVLDYTPDLAKLYQQISHVTKEQVAICLVPESASFIDFDENRIQRQDNIVYARGPFLASTFDEVLQAADTILADYASSTLDSGSCPYGGVAIEPTLEVTTSPIEKPSKPSPQPGSIPIPPVQTDLVQPMQALSMDFAPPPPPPPIPDIPPSPSPHPRKPKTLIVDDNAINLRLLELYCNRRAIPYRAATDGQQAVNLFGEYRSHQQHQHQHQQHQPFELVFMDLQMPVCDGIEATRRIRALEKLNGWNKSVIFIVTGQDSPADRAHADEAGADGYLVKPVGPKVLDRWVRQWFPDAQL